MEPPFRSDARNPLEEGPYNRIGRFLREESELKAFRTGIGYEAGTPGPEGLLAHAAMNWDIHEGVVPGLGPREEIFDDAAFGGIGRSHYNEEDLLGHIGGAIDELQQPQPYNWHRFHEELGNRYNHLFAEEQRLRARE